MGCWPPTSLRRREIPRRFVLAPVGRRQPPRRANMELRLRRRQWQPHLPGAATTRWLQRCDPTRTPAQRDLATCGARITRAATIWPASWPTHCQPFAHTTRCPSVHQIRGESCHPSSSLSIETGSLWIHCASSAHRLAFLAQMEHRLLLSMYGNRIRNHTDSRRNNRYSECIKFSNQRVGGPPRVNKPERNP